MPRRFATRFATIAVMAIACAAIPAQAQHACDAIGERGWHTVATVETVAQRDSAPRQAATAGVWYVDRAITRLPLCNYYNAVGNYSLRSYALSPETRTERVIICRPDAQGSSAALAPYTGPCPPQ